MTIKGPLQPLQIANRGSTLAVTAERGKVVQSQQVVASAHEQYISSLYNYNFAKISLIRALGLGEEGVKTYFQGK